MHTVRKCSHSHAHMSPKPKYNLVHILRHRAAAKARTLWSGLLPVEPAPNVCNHIVQYTRIICKHILCMHCSHCIICKNGTPYLYSTKCTNMNVFGTQYCTSCIAFFLQSTIGMSQLLCSGTHPARVCYLHLTYTYILPISSCHSHVHI